MKSKYYRQNKEIYANLCIAFLTICLMMSVVIVDAYNAPQASATDTTNEIPKLAHKVPESPSTKWNPITDFHASFHDENGHRVPLDKGSTYWTADNLFYGVTGEITQQKVDNQYPVLMRNNYNDNEENTTLNQTLSVAMYLTPVKQVAAAKNPFSIYISSSQAMGRFGGDARNPNGAYSIFMWYWGGGPIVGNLNCSSISNTTNGYYTPVIRFDDYLPGEDPWDTTNSNSNIFWTCMPTPGGVDGAAGGQFGFPSRGGSTQATGGEMNQSNGFLYIAGATSGNVVNVTGNSSQMNNGGIVYNIWDPFENSFSLSGPVQANDFSVGQKTPPHEQLAVTVINQDKQPPACKIREEFERSQREYNPRCWYSGGLQASPDMGLDASGNFYVYVQTSATTTAGNVTSALLRISPSVEFSRGIKTITDGSPENPWRYSLVTRTKHGNTFKPNGSLPTASQAVGAAVHNGNIFLTGYMPLIGTFTPADGSAYTAPYNATKYPVKVNPLTGEMNIITTTNNPDIASPFGSNTMINPLSYSAGNRDSASAQELMTIQGNVYHDEKATADYAQFSETGLQGLTLNLYDSKGKLLGTTRTSADGSYSFIVGGFGTYYVRLVQPQINRVNAFQTWSSVVGGYGTDPSSKKNKAEVICANGNIKQDSGERNERCQGAQPFPYIDPNPPLTEEGDQHIGNIDPAWNAGKPLWATYGKIELRTSYQNPIMNFAVSTAASDYGDASGYTVANQNKPANVGPFNTTNEQQGPFLHNPQVLTDIYKKADGLQLGNKLGIYSDGTPDANADSDKISEVNGKSHVETDDGVQLVIPINPTVDVSSYCSPNPTSTDIKLYNLKNVSLAAGERYCIKTKVNGEVAKSEAAKGTPSIVLGWQSPTAPSRNGGWIKVESELAFVTYAGNNADGTGDIAETYSTFTVPATHSTALSPVQYRFMVVSNNLWKNNNGKSDDMSQSQFLVDNKTGVYNGPKPFSPAADVEYFIQPGEIEDYQYYSSNFTLSIVAQLSNEISNQLEEETEIKYNLDSLNDDISVNNDSVLLGLANKDRTMKTHLPKLDISQKQSSIVFTTGTPSVKLKNKNQLNEITVSSKEKPSCKGHYVGKSGSKHVYDIKLDALSDDSTVQQPNDQKSLDRSNVSYKINTNFNPTVDTPVNSGLSVVCTVIYDIRKRPDVLPEAGSQPWQYLISSGLVVVGVFLGVLYTIRWCKEQGYLDKNSKDSSSKN